MTPRLNPFALAMLALASMPLHAQTAPPASTAAQQVTVQGERPPRGPLSTTPVLDKAGLSAEDIPFSVQVLDKPLLLEQGALSLETALRNVSGMRTQRSYVPYESITARGFTSEPLRDGRRVLYLALPLSNVDAVEVLKGPAAVQYGRVEPGGVVNLVTRRARQEPRREFELELGSHDHVRAAADLGGALGAGSGLSWRLGAEHLDEKSFIDHAFNKRTFIAPTLRWQPSADTRVDVSLEYRDQKTSSTPGIPVIGTRPAKVPFHSYYGEPGLNDHYRAWAGTLDFETRIDPQWSVKGGLGVWRGDYKYGGLYTVTLAPDLNTLNVGFALVSDYDKRNTDDLYLDVIGRFDAGGMNHRLVLGVDHHRQHENMNWYGNSDGAIVFPPKTLGLPTYGVDVAAFRAHAPDAYWVNRARWTGVHLQDLMSITPQWQLLLGGRYDRTTVANGFTETSLQDSLALLAGNRIDLSRFSPKLGVVWKADAHTHWYASAAQAFGAGNGRNARNEVNPPESSRQYEVGLKQRIWDGRVEYTVALYQLTKRNIATDDPSTDDPFDTVLVGQARSRGLEMDLAGELARGLRMTASLAWNDTRITHDQYGNQGHRLPNAPRASGSVWLHWEPAGSAWSLSAGVFAASQVQGDKENTFQLPGYGQVDAAASYRFKAVGADWTAQFNVYNLFDRRYFASSGGWRDMTHPADPRAVKASLRMAF